MFIRQQDITDLVPEPRGGEVRVGVAHPGRAVLMAQHEIDDAVRYAEHPLLGLEGAAERLGRDADPPGPDGPVLLVPFGLLGEPFARIIQGSGLVDPLDMGGELGGPAQVALVPGLRGAEKDLAGFPVELGGAEVAFHLEGTAAPVGEQHAQGMHEGVEVGGEPPEELPDLLGLEGDLLEDPGLPDLPETIELALPLDLDCRPGIPQGERDDPVLLVGPDGVLELVCQPGLAEVVHVLLGIRVLEFIEAPVLGAAEPVPEGPEPSPMVVRGTVATVLLQVCYVAVKGNFGKRHWTVESIIHIKRA